MLKVKNRKRIVLSILFTMLCIFLSASILFSSGFFNQSVLADNEQENGSAVEDVTVPAEDGFSDDADWEDYSAEEDLLSQLGEASGSELSYLSTKLPDGIDASLNIDARFKWNFPALNVYREWQEAGVSSSGTDVDRFEVPYGKKIAVKGSVLKASYNVYNDVFGDGIRDWELYQKVRVTDSTSSIWSQFGGGWIPASTKTFKKFIFDVLGNSSYYNWGKVRGAVVKSIGNSQTTASCWVNAGETTASCFLSHTTSAFPSKENGIDVNTNASNYDYPDAKSGRASYSDGFYSFAKGYLFAYFPYDKPTNNSVNNQATYLEKSEAGVSLAFNGGWLSGNALFKSREANNQSGYQNAPLLKSGNYFLNLKTKDGYSQYHKHPVLKANYRFVNSGDFPALDSNNNKVNIAFLTGVTEDYSNASGSKSQYSGYYVSIPETVKYNGKTYHVIVADRAFKNNTRLLGACFADFSSSFLNDPSFMNARNEFQDRDADDNMYFGFKNGNASSGTMANSYVKCYDTEGLVCNRNSSKDGCYLVEPIGKSAFQGCSSLKYLILPKNIEKLPYGMLVASGIPYLNLPKSVKTIDYYMVYGNSNLSSINIGYDTNQPNEVALKYWNCKYNNNAMLNYTPIMSCSNVSGLTFARKRTNFANPNNTDSTFGVSNGILYQYKYDVNAPQKRVPNKLVYATNYLVSASYSPTTFTYMDSKHRSSYLSDLYIDISTNKSPYALTGELSTSLNDTSRLGLLFKYFSRTRTVFEAKARQWTSGPSNINEFDRIDYYYPAYDVKNADELEMCRRVWANKKIRNIYYSKYQDKTSSKNGNNIPSKQVLDVPENPSATGSFNDWIKLSDPNRSKNGSGQLNEPIPLVNTNALKKDSNGTTFYYPEKIIYNFSGDQKNGATPRSKKTYVDFYIPDTVEEVFPSAFYSTAGLRNVFIPNSLQYLGANNFYYTETSQLMGNATMQSVRFYNVAQTGAQQNWPWLENETNKNYFYLSFRNPGYIQADKQTNKGNYSIKFIDPMNQQDTETLLKEIARDNVRFFSLSNGMAFDNFGNGALTTNGTIDNIKYKGRNFNSYTSSLVQISNDSSSGFLQTVIENLVAEYYKDSFKYDFDSTQTNIQKYVFNDFKNKSDSERSARQDNANNKNMGIATNNGSNHLEENIQEKNKDAAGLYSSGEWVDAGQTQAYMEVNASSISPEQPVNRSYYFLIDSSGSMYGYMPKTYTALHETASDSLTNNSSKFTKNLVAWTFIKTYSDFLIDHAESGVIKDSSTENGDKFYLKSYLGLRAFRDVYSKPNENYSTRTNNFTVMDSFGDRFEWFWRQVCKEYDSKYETSTDQQIAANAPNVVMHSNVLSPKASDMTTYNPNDQLSAIGNDASCYMINMYPRNASGVLLKDSQLVNAHNDLKKVIMKYIQYCCGACGGQSYYSGPIRETINGLTDDSVYNIVSSKYCIQDSANSYKVTEEIVKPMFILIGDGEDTQHNTASEFYKTIFSNRTSTNTDVSQESAQEREAFVRSKLDFSGLLISSMENGRMTDHSWQHQFFNVLCGDGNVVVLESGKGVGNAISALSAFTYGKYYVDVDVDTNNFDVQLACVAIGGTHGMNNEAENAGDSHYPNVPSSLSAPIFDNSDNKDLYVSRIQSGESTIVTTENDINSLNNLQKKYINVSDSTIGTRNDGTTRYRICFNALPNMNRINKLVFLLKLKNEKATGNISAINNVLLRSSFLSNNGSLGTLTLNRSGIKILKTSKNSNAGLPNVEFETKYKNTNSNLSFANIQTNVNGGYLRAIDKKTPVVHNDNSWERATLNSSSKVKTSDSGNIECYGYFDDAPASPNNKVVFTETAPPAGYKVAAPTDVSINNTSATKIVDPYLNGQITLNKVVDITNAGIDTTNIDSATSDNYKNCLKLLSGLSWDFDNLLTIDKAPLKTNTNATFSKIVVSQNSSSQDSPKPWRAYWKTASGTVVKETEITWDIKTKSISGKTYLVFSAKLLAADDSAVSSYRVQEKVPNTSIFYAKRSSTKANYCEYNNSAPSTSTIINTVNANNSTLSNIINVSIADANNNNSDVIFINYLPDAVPVGLTKQNDGIVLSDDYTFKNSVAFTYTGTIGDGVAVSGRIIPDTSSSSSVYSSTSTSLNSYTYRNASAFNLIPGQYVFSEKITYPASGSATVVPFSDVKNTYIQGSSISNDDIITALNGLRPTFALSNPVSNNTNIPTASIKIDSSKKTEVVFRNIRANAIVVRKSSDDGIIEGFTFRLTNPSTLETKTATTNSSGIARFENIPVYSSGNTKEIYTIKEENVPKRYGTPKFSYDGSTILSTNGVLNNVSINMRQNVPVGNLSADSNVLSVRCNNPSEKVNVRIKKVVKDAVDFAKGIHFTITGFTANGQVVKQLVTNTSNTKEGTNSISYTDTVSLPIYDSNNSPIRYSVDENSSDMAKFTGTTFTSNKIPNFNKDSFSLENISNSFEIICTNERSNGLEIVKQNEENKDLTGHAGDVTFTIKNDQSKVCYFKNVGNEYVYAGISSGSNLVKDLPIDNLGKVKIKGLENKYYTVSENATTFVLSNYNGVAPSKTITITKSGPNKLTFKNFTKTQNVSLVKFADDVSQEADLTKYIYGTTFSIVGTTVSGTQYNDTITIDNTNNKKSSTNSKLGLFKKLTLPYGVYRITETVPASSRYDLNKTQFKVNMTTESIVNISNGMSNGKTVQITVDSNFKNREIVFLNKPRTFNLTVYKTIVGLDENLQQEAVARKVSANTQFLLSSDSMSNVLTSSKLSSNNWKYVKSYVPNDESALNGAVFSYTFYNIPCTKEENGAQIKEFAAGPYTTTANGCVYVDRGTYKTWEDYEEWYVDETNGVIYDSLPPEYIDNKIDLSISSNESVAFVNRILPSKIRIVKSDDLSNDFKNTNTLIAFKSNVLTRLKGTKFVINYPSPSTSSGSASKEIVLDPSDAINWYSGSQQLPETSTYKFYIYRDILLPYRSENIKITEKNMPSGYSAPIRQVYATPSSMEGQIFDLSLSDQYKSSVIEISNTQAYGNHPMFVFNNIHEEQSVYINKSIVGIDKNNIDSLLNMLSRNDGQTTIRISDVHRPNWHQDFVFDETNIKDVDKDGPMYTFDDCPPFESGDTELAVVYYDTSLPPGTYTIEEILPPNTVYEKSNNFPKYATDPETADSFDSFGLDQQSNLNKKSFSVPFSSSSSDYTNVYVVNRVNTGKITLSKISNISFENLDDSTIKDMFGNLRFRFTNKSNGIPKIVNARDASWSVKTTSDNKYKYITCEVELEDGEYTLTEEYMPGTKESNKIFGDLSETASFGDDSLLTGATGTVGNSMSFNTSTNKNIVFKNNCKETQITLLKAATNIKQNASEQNARTLLNGVSFRITDGNGEERTEVLDNTWKFNRGTKYPYFTKTITIYPGSCSFEELYNGDIFDTTKTHSAYSSVSSSSIDAFLDTLIGNTNAASTTVNVNVSNFGKTVVFLNSPKAITLDLYKTASDLLVSSNLTNSMVYGQLKDIKFKLTNLTDGGTTTTYTVPTSNGSGWFQNQTNLYEYIRCRKVINAGMYLVEEVEGNSNYDIGYASHYTKGCNDTIINKAITGSSFTINTADCYAATDTTHTGPCIVGFHNKSAGKTICLQKAVVSPTLNGGHTTIVSEEVLRKLFCFEYDGYSWCPVDETSTNQYKVAFEIYGENSNGNDTLLYTVPVDNTWEYTMNARKDKGILYKEISISSANANLYNKIYVKEIYNEEFEDTLPFNKEKTYSRVSGNRRADESNTVLKDFTSMVYLVNNYDAIDILVSGLNAAIGDTSLTVTFNPSMGRNFAHYAFVNTLIDNSDLSVLKSAEDFSSRRNSILADENTADAYVKSRLSGISFTAKNEWTGEIINIPYSSSFTVDSVGSWKYMSFGLEGGVPFGEYTITENMSSEAEKIYDPDDIWVSPYGQGWTNPWVDDRNSMREHFVILGKGVRSNTISHVVSGSFGPIFVNTPKSPTVKLYKVVDGIKDNITESEFRSLVNGTKITLDWVQYEIDNSWNFVSDYYCAPLGKKVPAVYKEVDDVSYDVEFKELSVPRYLDISLAKYYIDNDSAMKSQSSENMKINVMDGNMEHSITFVNSIKMVEFKLCKTATDISSSTSLDEIKNLFDGITFRFEHPYVNIDDVVMNKDDFTTKTKDKTKWILDSSSQYGYMYKLVRVPAYSVISEVVNQNYEQTLVNAINSSETAGAVVVDSHFDSLCKAYVRGTPLKNKLSVSRSANNSSLYIFCNSTYESKYALYKTVKGNLTQEMMHDITNGIEIKLRNANSSVNGLEYSFVIDNTWEYVGQQESAVGTITTIKKVVSVKSGTYKVSESVSDSFDMSKTVLLKNRTSTNSNNVIPTMASGTNYVSSKSNITLPRVNTNDNIDICYVVNTPQNAGKLRIVKSSTSMHNAVNDSLVRGEFVGIKFNIKSGDNVVKVVEITDSNKNDWSIGVAGDYKYIYFDVNDLPYGLYDVEEVESSLTRHTKAYCGKEINDLGSDRMSEGYVVSGCSAWKDTPGTAAFFNVSKNTKILIEKIVEGKYSREDLFKLMSGLKFNITVSTDTSYLKTVTIPDINDASAEEWKFGTSTVNSKQISYLYTVMPVASGKVTVSEVLTDKFDPNGIAVSAQVQSDIRSLLNKQKSDQTSATYSYAAPNENDLSANVCAKFFFLNTLSNKDIFIYKLANDTTESDNVSEEMLHEKFDGISFSLTDTMNTDSDTVYHKNLVIGSDWQYMQESNSDFGFGILYKTVSVPVGNYVVEETLQSSSDYDPNEIYFANSLTDILNKNSRTHVDETNKATISTLNNQDELYFYNTTGIKEITLTKVVPGVRTESDLREVCKGLSFNIVDVKNVFESVSLTVNKNWLFTNDSVNDYGMLSFKTTIRPGSYVIKETFAHYAEATFDTDKTQVSFDINKFINNTAEKATEIRVNSSQIRNNRTIFFLNERRIIPVTLIKAMPSATYATTKEDLLNAVKNTEFEVVNAYTNTVVFDEKINDSWSDFNYDQNSSFATLSKTIYLPKGRYSLTEKIGNEANLKYFKTENGGSSVCASAGSLSLFLHNLDTTPIDGRSVDFSTLYANSYCAGFLNKPANVKIRIEKIVRAYGDFVSGSSGSMSIDNFKQIVSGVQFKVAAKSILQKEIVRRYTINTSSRTDKWTFEQKMINGNKYCVAYQDVPMPLGTVDIEEIIPSNNDALDPNNVVYGGDESIVAASTTASKGNKHTLNLGLTHVEDARYSFWKNNIKHVTVYVKKTASNFTNKTSQETMINNLNGLSFRLVGTSPYYGNVSRQFTIDKNSESCLNALGLDRNNNAIYFAFNIPYGTTCSVEELIGSNNVYSLLHSTVSLSLEDAKQRAENGTTKHANKIEGLAPTPSDPVVVYFYNREKEKPDFEIKFEKMVDGVAPATPTNISYATNYSTTIKVIVKNNSEETNGVNLPINIGMIPLNGENWQKLDLNGGPTTVSIAPGESKTITYAGIDKFQNGSTIKSFLNSYSSGLHTLRAEINYNNRLSEKVSTNNSDFTVVDSKDWSANSVGIYSSDGSKTPTVESGSTIKVSPTFTYIRNCNMGTNKAKLTDNESDAFDKTALIQEKGIDPDLKESYVVKDKDAYLQFYFRYAGTSTDILMSTPDGDEEGKVYLKDLELSLLNNKKEYAGPVAQNEQGEYVLSSRALIRAENIRLQLPEDLPADQLNKNHTITVAIRFGDRTDETNIDNNTKAQTIKVVENIKLVVQKVTPNSAYYEDTDVITTFKVINESSKEFIGTNDFKLAFTVVDSSTGSTIASSEEGLGLDEARKVEPEIVVPGNSLNYYYWKWHVPEGISGHKLLCTATISGSRKSSNTYFEGIRKNENGLYDQDTLTKVVSSVPISKTPDTSYTGSSKEQLKQILEDSSSKTNKTLIESFLTRLSAEYKAIVLYGDKTDIANPETGLFDEDLIHKHKVETLNSAGAAGEDEQNYYYQNTAVWEEWIYNNTTSSFEKLTYNAYLNSSNSINVSTDESNIVANGDYKSGYGFGIDAYASIKSDAGSATIEDSMYTCTQVASALFPENLFSGVIGKYETMYKKNPSQKPGTSNRFILKNSASDKEYSGKNIHFSPIWYPDGLYPVGVEFSQCWTPAGVLSLQTVNNSLEVKGSIYDDWYTR